MYKSISSSYGSNNTPCRVFTYETYAGIWYVVQGGIMVNLCPHSQADLLHESVELITDVDCFTWSDRIDSIEDLEFAMEY